VAAGPGTGSRGQGASSSEAGDGDGRGLDDRVADAPPSRFGEGGLSSCPLSIVAYPETAMALTVGIRSRRLIAVISRYSNTFPEKFCACEHQHNRPIPDFSYFSFSR
jgi:hypothetical protein